ncbi:DUF2948 family protein [Beijerinckia sp. L45]|uniref:DUF2948 family protein n=1 Tax=Beijerinckia sp. L45 TaxID=1641855 RepID=UPI00131E6250|nr:DUF2948 family protein [Beijerinckia sp. L45]
MTNPLRLVALDEDDLAVVSANLQDALIAVVDMAYLPQAKRFAMVGRRFDWVKAGAGVIERCAMGLHFERVLSVARTGFSQDESERVLNLLAVHFQPGEAPAGTIRLTFSGGAAVRLEVECLEAQMRDLGDRFVCDKQPAHPIEESAQAI